MKKALLEIFKNIIPVILGILIALFINNWNEQQKNEKYINKMLTSIKAELDESIKDIEENIPKQRRLVDSLTYYVADEKLSLLQISSKVDGLHAPRIKTNYSIALSNSRIELIDYKILSQLSTIEDGKNLLQEKLKILLQYIMENPNATSRESKQKLIFAVSDIISTEYGIKNSIKELDLENFKAE